MDLFKVLKPSILAFGTKIIDGFDMKSNVKTRLLCCHYNW